MDFKCMHFSAIELRLFVSKFERNNLRQRFARIRRASKPCENTISKKTAVLITDSALLAPPDFSTRCGDAAITRIWVLFRCIAHKINVPASGLRGSLSPRYCYGVDPSPLGLRFQDLQSLPYLTHYKLGEKLPAESDKKVMAKISKGSPYSITEHRVPELIPVLGSQPAGFLLPFCGEIKLCINPAVGCRYFPPGLLLPPQPLRGLLPISLLGEQRHNGCELLA